MGAEHGVSKMEQNNFLEILPLQAPGFSIAGVHINPT